LDSDYGGTQQSLDDGGTQQSLDDGGTCSNLSNETVSTSSDAGELPLLYNSPKATDGLVDCCCHFHCLIGISSSRMMTLLGSCPSN